MNAIEGYASTTSVFPGETITFSVCVQPPYFNLQVNIYRIGKAEVLLLTGLAHAMTYPTPADPDQNGCGWPPAYTLTIPDNWVSGLYVARFSSTPIGPGTPTTDIRFVVKAAAPGASSPILFQLVANTCQAYNAWAGRNLYTGPAGWDDRARKVSFNRPGVGFYDYEIPFVQWLENNGFTVEYCTSIDLHQDSNLLNKYQLLLSVGHDEYWSKEMRDNVEAFVQNGGNAAFFSGNVCWWQVRFEDGCQTMVCFKTKDEDPLAGVDDSRVTVNWFDQPVNCPENLMTGVSFNHGGGWWDPQPGPRPAVGYRVRLGQHWVFAGTGLNDDDEFGKESLIVGYEADGAEFVEQVGVPQVTGRDGTPSDFLILATADLSGWAQGTNWAGYDKKGCATMGIYQKNGVVFTAGTTDWRMGLQGAWNPVSQITVNVLQRLQRVCGSGLGIDGYDLRSTSDRAIAFDYDGSGKLDYLVLYRPGTGAIWILQNTAAFNQVYTPGMPATGIGGYDMSSPADQVLAFDYDSSGKLDHLVLYRPGTGTIWILQNTAGTFTPVYTSGTPAAGIGGYDLNSPADRILAFDYDSSGKLDHLVLYRPGTGTIWILQNTTGTFTSVYTSGTRATGIGGYDMSSPTDQILAFDYDSSGKLDHLVLYRPGTGTIWILQNTTGTFTPLYTSGTPAVGIGGYDLNSPADQILAFDYDSSGKLDHLVLYRPGTGTIRILRNTAGTFTSVYMSGNSAPGIGGYNLGSLADRAFALDYDGSGKLDHLGLYRPGTGVIWILKNADGTFVPVYKCT